MLRCAINSTRWSSRAESGVGRGRRPNGVMLRLSHCQTALLGKRGGGRGGGGRLPESPAREECSDPAAQASEVVNVCSVVVGELTKSR